MKKQRTEDEEKPEILLKPKIRADSTLIQLETYFQERWTAAEVISEQEFQDTLRQLPKLSKCF